MTRPCRSRAAERGTPPSRPRGPRALGAALALLLLPACAALRHVDDPAPAVRGPIPARIEHPLALSFLGFRPRRARVHEAGERTLALDSAYASIYEQESGGGDAVVFDGELWHNALRLRWGTSANADVEIELQTLYAGGGFLDDFIESWHELFGFSNGGREDRPQDEFAMEVATGGTTIYALEPHELLLGDLPIVWTQGVHADPEQGAYLAWRAGIELPTGSQADGAGNGGLDVGFGVLGERSFGRWTASGALDVVVPAQPDDFAEQGVRIDERFDAQAGIEYRWSDRLSLLLGTVWASPLTDDIDLEEIDGHFLDLGLGAAWDLGERSRLQLSFHEDLVAAVGADLSLVLGWTSGF